MSASRPSRIFSSSAPKNKPTPIPQEIKDLRDAREARLARIYSKEDDAKPAEDPAEKARKQKEEARLAEEK